MVNHKVEKICSLICVSIFIGAFGYASYLASASKEIQKQFCPGGVVVNSSDINIVDELNKFSNNGNTSFGLFKNIKKLSNRISIHLARRNKTVNFKNNVNQ